METLFIGVIAACGAMLPFGPIAKIPDTAVPDIAAVATAYTADGKVAVLYGSNTAMYFDRYDPATDTWSGRQSIGLGLGVGGIYDDSGAAGNISLTVTGDGTYHAMWTEAGSPADLIWAKATTDGGGNVNWELATQVIGGGSVRRLGPRLVYDLDDEQIVAAWSLPSDKELRVASWVPTADSVAVDTAVDPPKHVYFVAGQTWISSLDINPSTGEPVVVAQFQATGGQDIMFARRTGGTWEPETNITDTDGENDRIASIAHLTDGTAIVVYDTTTTGDLSFRRSDEDWEVVHDVDLQGIFGGVGTGLVNDGLGNIIGLVVDEGTDDENGLLEGLIFVNIDPSDNSVTTSMLTTDIAKVHSQQLIPLDQPDGAAMAVFLVDDDLGNGTLYFARQTPEPSTLSLLGLGAAGLLLLLWWHALRNEGCGKVPQTRPSLRSGTCHSWWNSYKLFA